MSAAPFVRRLSIVVCLSAVGVLVSAAPAPAGVLSKVTDPQGGTMVRYEGSGSEQSNISVSFSNSLFRYTVTETTGVAITALPPCSSLSASVAVCSEDITRQTFEFLGGSGTDAATGSGGDHYLLNGGDGNDTLSVSGGVPARFPSSAGADTLVGGDGDDRFEQGADVDGNDTFTGNAGTDTLDYSARGSGLMNIDLRASHESGYWFFESDYAQDDLERGLGGPGSDYMSGNALDNTLEGGDGSDEIDGGAGSDQLSGGAGSDQLADTGGNKKDDFDGGADTDTVSYSGRAAAVTIDLSTSPGSGGEPGEDDSLHSIESAVGSMYGDRLIGSDEPNVLTGRSGDDTLDGRGGADFLNGGSSPGGDDLDVVDYSGRTADVTAGIGGTDDDGAAGEGDTINVDVEGILGGSGADVLAGDANDNHLSGNGGADVLAGGDGADTLDGGDDDDRFDQGGTNDGPDDITSGPGVDALDYSMRSTALNVDLRAHQPGVGEAGEGDDLYDDVERGLAGDGDDTMTGSSSANRLDGGAGDDTIQALGGNDDLFGAEGADFLQGGDDQDVLHAGAGADINNGGNGTDTLTYAARTDRVVIHLDGQRNDGADPSGNGFSGAAEENDRDVAVEVAVAGSGDDRITGNVQANTLAGGPGDDILDPRLGNDTVDGGDGNDTMTYAKYAGSQPVTLRLDGLANDGTMGESDHDVGIESAIAGGGNDVLVGNAGDNRLVGSGGNDVLEGGLGSDTLDGRAGIDTMTYAGRTENLAIILDNARNDGADTNGNGGSSTLEEGDEDQSIENAIGGSGNDRVTGNARSNTVRGGDGDDVVDGGPGGDTVDGGNGTDTMFYGFRSAADRVAVILDGARNDGSDPDGNGVSAAGEENDRDVAIENATGGSGNDLLTGNPSLNVLDGRTGNDLLRGRDFTALVDRLLCGLGSDSTTSDPSDDRVGCEVVLP